MIIALLIVCLCVIIRLYFFVGIGINDDMGYIHHARSIGNSINILANGGSQLAFRTGMVIPLAILYKLFGYKEIGFVIYPVLSSIISCLFIYFTAHKLWGKTAAIIASLFWVFYPLQIVFDTQLSPSNQHAMCVAASLYFFFAATNKFQSKQHKKYIIPILAMLCGASLGFAWLVNEIFVIMVIAAIPIIIVKKPSIKILGWITLGFGLVFLSDFTICRFASGSWLARINCILDTESVVVSNKNPYYYPQALFKILHPNFYGHEGCFGIIWYIFILTTLYSFIKRTWVAFGISLSTWFLLAYMQWGWQGPDGTPIAKYIRYISMLVPLQCLAMSNAFANCINQNKIWKVVLGIILILLFASSILYSAKVVKAAKIFTNDFRSIADFLIKHNIKNPIYTDSTTVQFVELYSQCKFNLNMVEYYNTNIPPETGLLITHASWGIIENIEYLNKMPWWYRNPLPSWKLICIINGGVDGFDLFDKFDPKIYRIQSDKSHKSINQNFSTTTSTSKNNAY